MGEAGEDAGMDEGVGGCMGVGGMEVVDGEEDGSGTILQGSAGLAEDTRPSTGGCLPDMR